MTLKLKTAPTFKPFTLAELKQQCRVDTADDDALLLALQDAAVSYLDGRKGVLGSCLCSQTWELYYDAFPGNELLVPLGPIISVVSVEYIDATGSYVTWPKSGNYEVDTVSPEAWIKPVNSWPTPADTMNAVRVTFTAGYATAAEIPAAIRQAMLLLIGHWYENREASVVGAPVVDLPFAVDALLAPFRRQVV